MAALVAALLFAVGLAAAPSTVVPARCTADSAKVRPRSVVVACGDGNFYFTRIAWTTWTARRATGTGIGNVNDCIPNCVGGRFHTYRAAVTLSRPVRCAGRVQFGSIAWRYLAAKPATAPRSAASPLPCIA